MTFEANLGSLNETLFFREFTYSNTTFQYLSQQYELADNIICIGNILIVFQLKERVISSTNTETSERKWFENKILKKAIKQIKFTIDSIYKNKSFELRNRKNHVQTINIKDITYFHNLVVYQPTELLPETCKNIKYHTSRTDCFVHIFSSNDYKGILHTLLTISELNDYLIFRENLLRSHGTTIDSIPEQAIIGQYLSGNLDATPSFDYIEYLLQLNKNQDDWNISNIIATYQESLYTKSNYSTEYYHIIRELSLLMRNELRIFKERLVAVRENARANKNCRPYRFIVNRTSCGFVLFSETTETIPNRRIGLVNFTNLHKYENKLSKCIGVSIADAGDGNFTVEWLYTESPWVRDLLFEDEVRKKEYPFRPLKQHSIPRYEFIKSD